MLRRTAQLATVFCLLSSLTAPASLAALIEADVEQDGIVISDETGTAEILPGETATIAIYLVLDVGEMASTFEAGFDLGGGGPGVDIEIDLGRVDPGEVPLGVGTWTSAVANLVGDEARVSLTRNNEGGESLVVDLIVSGLTGEEDFEVVLADREATGDLDDPPFFEIVPIGTASGTVLATLLVPEPALAVLQLAALLVLVALQHARAPARAVRH